MKRSLTSVLALVVLTAVFAVGCGSDSSDTSPPTTAVAPEPDTTAVPSTLTGTVTVSAASSLTEAFTEIGEVFHAANPDVEVEFNFDSSSSLSRQILDGAPADVYASADIVNMTQLTDANLIAGEPRVFARNELIIVTKPGNPEGISGLDDLDDAGVISLCGAEVPCGKFAQQALDGADVSISEGNITRGQNVKATLNAVSEGDAVAGIVYVTDALAAGDAVDTVVLPPARNVIVTYPIGVIAASAEPTLSQLFMSYVLSPAGQVVLQRLGFLPPS